MQWSIVEKYAKIYFNYKQKFSMLNASILPLNHTPDIKLHFFLTRGKLVYTIYVEENISPVFDGKVEEFVARLLD